MFTRLRLWGWFGSLSLILCCALVLSSSALAASVDHPWEETSGTFIPSRGDLIPIGADYQPDTLELFIQRALEINRDDRVELRVLLPSFSSNARFQPPEERQINLEDAQVRVDQIQAACEAVVAPDLICNTTLPDIQVRADARDQDKVAAFDPEVDGVYGLGGDQVIAMQVIANTPLESALEDLYQQGVPLGGNSAGAAIQSRNMIAGYTGDNFAWNGLEQGAVDLAYGRARRSDRGLIFGLRRGVIEQHALQRGRILRALQAAQQLRRSRLGIGPDWRTGVVIEEQRRIARTVGFTSAIVLDEETFGAADGAIYTGDRNSLSIHGVAVHLLPEGPYGYDLTRYRPLLENDPVPPPSFEDRRFELLRRPEGSGPLLIAGDLLDDGPEVIEPIRRREALRRDSVLSRFIDLARGAGGNTLVLALGDEDSTQAEADQIAQFLDRRRLTVEQATLTSDAFLEELFDRMEVAEAIYITSTRQSTVAALVDQLRDLHIDELNREGRVMLFDDAAAAAVGEWMTAEDGPEDSLDAKEEQASPPFLASYASAIVPGLGLISGATFEPRSFYDYRAGRSVALVYHTPTAVAFGIERETALELTPEGAVVRGPAAVMVLDGRKAPVIEAGRNEGIAIFWMLLDTFTTDQTLVGAD